jgi:hypothetical protein
MLFRTLGETSSIISGDLDRLSPRGTETLKSSKRLFDYYMETITYTYK